MSPKDVGVPGSHCSSSGPSEGGRDSASFSVTMRTAAWSIPLGHQGNGLVVP